MSPEEVVRSRRRAEQEIEEAKDKLCSAAHVLVFAEERLKTLQNHLCQHPNQTHRDGGWQGTADIYDCPDCGMHKVSD
jgi:hypothetical protein